MALIGGALGVVVAMQTFPLLDLLVPRPLAGLSQVALDWRVLAVTAALSALTGVLFGLAPAWRASRIEYAIASTQQFGRGVVRGGSRLRSALVVGQIALATALLIGAGLFVQSLRSAQNVPLGFDPALVTTLRLTSVETDRAFSRRARSVDVRANQKKAIASGEKGDG